MSVDATRTWLEKEDPYTLQRHVRKLFACNPCTVTNVMDEWQCDFLDVRAYAKYIINRRYMLSVIDVLWKFLHMIPIKTNSGVFRCLSVSLYI